MDVMKRRQQRLRRRKGLYFPKGETPYLFKTRAMPGVSSKLDKSGDIEVSNLEEARYVVQLTYCNRKVGKRHRDVTSYVNRMGNLEHRQSRRIELFYGDAVKHFDKVLDTVKSNCRLRTPKFKLREQCETILRLIELRDPKECNNCYGYEDQEFHQHVLQECKIVHNEEDGTVCLCGNTELYPESDIPLDITNINKEVEEEMETEVRTLSEVTKSIFAASHCKLSDSELSDWDVSKDTNLDNVFRQCKLSDNSLSDWDFSNGSKVFNKEEEDEEETESFRPGQMHSHS